MGSHITSIICTVLYLILKFLHWWPDDGLFRLKHVDIPENVVVFDGIITICFSIYKTVKGVYAFRNTTAEKF
jgi:hypothetical protein